MQGRNRTFRDRDGVSADAPTQDTAPEHDRERTAAWPSDPTASTWEQPGSARHHGLVPADAELADAELAERSASAAPTARPAGPPGGAGPLGNGREGTAGPLDGAAATGGAGFLDTVDGVPADDLHGADPAPPSPPSLLGGDVERLREEWRDVQIRFVDDPAQAVRDADTLLGTLVEALSARLAELRRSTPAGMTGGDGTADGHRGSQPDASRTEELRLVLRRYRSVFDRLTAV